MDIIKEPIENILKVNYLSKNMELKMPNFIDSCLKVLENFTLMLLNTNEKISRFPKLNYCYCYFNAIRWQLINSASLNHNFIMEIAKSIIKRLQSSLRLFDTSKHCLSFSPESNKHRSILSPIIGKYNICRRNNKRKKKSNKKRQESLNRDNCQKIILNKFYWSLFYLNNENASNLKACNMQHIIELVHHSSLGIDAVISNITKSVHHGINDDECHLIASNTYQMYIQIRTVLSENGIDQEDIFNELNISKEKGILSKSINNRKPLSPPINTDRKPLKYQEQLWSGDCKLSDDSHDIFSDQFDKLLALNNLDIDFTALTAKLLTSNNGFMLPNKRFRKYSELDEGFSETEFVYDLSTKQDENEYSEFLSCEKFSYCGDCHYNSSNSKSDEKNINDKCLEKDETPVKFIDDGSDSDGGTELLNSVNDTVNKFNAFMQFNLNAEYNKQSEDKSSNFSKNSIEQITTDNSWPSRYPNILHNRMAYDEFSNIAPHNKSYETNELVTPDPNSLTSLVTDSTVYKDDRPDQKFHNASNIQQQSSATSQSNFNYDTLSKMVVSPVSIQNWCSYNFSQIPSQPCNFGYQTKSNLNIDVSSAQTENYCSTKLSNWLPPISHGLITSNSYFIGSNSAQQPFHRIMITPHLSLPPGNLTPVQHNIIHLPQLFHQLPHSLMDTEYFDRRQIQLNPQLQFSNPNNNNSSSDFSLISPANLIANSNSSNMSLRQPPMSIIKTSLDKSQRACCFYMRGGCKKEDCEYAHDLSKVTCKFWEKGDCFKADTCPFKHGYVKE